MFPTDHLAPAGVQRPSAADYRPWRVGLRKQAKAILGALAAACAVLGPVSLDGIDSAEAIDAVRVALVTYGAVFGVGNAPGRTEG